MNTKNINNKKKKYIQLTIDNYLDNFDSENKKKIIINKKILYKIFNDEIIPNYSIKELCFLWNIHQGTINRWILKKEVPENYFNHINKILNNKYILVASEQEHYKNMDQFYTPEILAKNLINETLDFIETNWKINFKEYSLIEPSAGSGSFYLNFPKYKFKNLIGLDIEPKNEKILRCDWLEFESTNNKNIVIGNPPFGLRGQLALQFINKAAEIADFVCFILPPLFNSNGKGSPMLRINKNFYLAKEIKIGDEYFYYPDNKKVKIHCIYQIWTKLNSEKIKPILPPKKLSEWIKVYSLSNGNSPSSKRNVKMIGKCDYYLPSTTFQKINLETSFDKLPHNRGYGIVILKEHNKINKIINKINWNNEGFKSTNSANNLRSQLIIEAVEREVNDL